jgi:hypothetical protein
LFRSIATIPVKAETRTRPKPVSEHRLYDMESFHRFVVSFLAHGRHHMHDISFPTLEGKCRGFPLTMPMFPLNSVALSDVDYECEQGPRKFGRQEIAVDAMPPLYPQMEKTPAADIRM